jgi:putative ABC transport system permease protein
MALSGSFSQSKGSVFLRNVLITLQFFFAITLIIVAIFIKVQHSYMLNYSWGIQKENIIYLPVYKGDVDVTTLMDELKQNPDVLDYTISPSLPGKVRQNWGGNINGKQIAFTSWIVKSNFLDFFGIEVIDGRNFIPSDDGKSRVICNQAFLRKFEYTDIIGAKISNPENAEIVGVIKDVNFESLHFKIQPLCFVTKDYLNSYYRYWLFIKISGNNTIQTLDYIKGTWNKLSNEPFDLNFLNTTMNDLYQHENNLAKLISIFGLIAVIIAVMGVYGLIVFNAKYKQKEIAIRKVNGSTLQEIMLLLNRNVLIQLGIAFVAAIPVAYIVVDKWLESFAYQTAIYWWVFALGGLIILTITLITVSAQSFKSATRNPTEALNSE